VLTNIRNQENETIRANLSTVDNYDLDGAKMFHRIFETADYDGFSAVSGGANDEEVAESLIKNDLWRDPTVRAA